ncbi:hypothetical protein TSAR_009456 [Trichomalopsis sarcophagae]|uniref:Uncharacterized protein n=1 Tax=Trichomalopsis sarcophagae TaxID=543379 RepID=A0A232ET32_9HYME|nr:hypothetical protein TSAR_009456 [Trichomalopsis sarcophagae]
MSKKYASSSLWSYYSMLGATVNTFNLIDISNYKKMLYLFKRISSGYRPKSR